jgi:hypothetical protein
MYKIGSETVGGWFPSVAEKKCLQSRNLKSRYGARNWFQEPSLELSSQAHRLAGRYNNRMPTWFLAPIAGLKLPAQWFGTESAGFVIFWPPRIRLLVLTLLSKPRRNVKETFTIHLKNKKNIWFAISFLNLFLSFFLKLKGNFLFFFYFYVRYSTLPLLRFHCVGRCWDRTQDSCDYGIGCQKL